MTGREVNISPQARTLQFWSLHWASERAVYSSAFYGDGDSSGGGIQGGGNDDLKTLQRRFCDLIQTIGKLNRQCDTPEEVMRLLLDVGDNGEINHPENRAFSIS